MVAKERAKMKAVEEETLINSSSVPVRISYLFSSTLDEIPEW